MRSTIVSITWLAAAVVASAGMGQRTASVQDVRQAEHDVPKLADVLELAPGMSVADIGAGYGEMAIVMARRVGPTGRVYATDIAATQLEAIRAAVSRGRVENVTVI